MIGLCIHAGEAAPECPMFMVTEEAKKRILELAGYAGETSNVPVFTFGERATTGGYWLLGFSEQSKIDEILLEYPEVFETSDGALKVLIDGPKPMFHLIQGTVYDYRDGKLAFYRGDEILFQPDHYGE